VDQASEIPVYEQIRAQLAAKISAEKLAPGAKLPTIRALAAELGLAVNTVAHAYRELESAGLVQTRPRHGTTVASGQSTKAGAGPRERLRESARQYAGLARQLGLDGAQARAIILEELARPQ
jgi:DNA-binding transcriptional regulator YhcF (GntR family)